MRILTGGVPGQAWVAELHLAEGKGAEPAELPVKRKADLVEKADTAGLADLIPDAPDRHADRVMTHDTDGPSLPHITDATARQVVPSKVDPDPMDAVERPTFRGLVAIAEFRALIIGFLLHLASGTVATLAISVLVYERTHSALLSAISLASSYLPHIIGAVLLLSLADRLPARRGLTFVSFVQVLTLGVVALGVLPVGAILLIILLGGVAQPIGTAIRSAALPDILGSGAQYVLGRAVVNMTSYSAQALGFAVGGVFVATVGTHGALWMATAVSLVVIGVNWFGLKNRPARATATGSALRQTWKTNGFLLRTRAIRGLLLSLWLPLTLAGGAEALFVPFAARHGSTSLASAFFWAITAGNFAGDLLVGRLVSPARQARLSFPLALLLAAPLICFVAQPPVIIAVGLCFVSAIGASYHLGLQHRFLDVVPLQVRAQAFGLIYSGIPALQGIMFTLAGAVVAVGTPSGVIALFGLASGISTVALASHIHAKSKT